MMFLKKLTTTTALQFNQILRQGGIIITSILLVKIGLSTTDIGIYETLLFIGTTVSYFWVNALVQTSLTYIPSVPETEKSKTIFNIFLIFNSLSILLFILLFFFPYFITSFLEKKTELPYLNLYAVFLLLNFPPLLLESLWTVEETPLSIVNYAVLSHLFLPIAIALPLWFGNPFIWSFYGMIGVALIRYIWLAINVLSRHKGTVLDVKHIYTFFILALPLMAYSFLNGFVMSFISWLVNWYHEGDKQIFAVFRYGAREFPLALALAAGLSNAAIAIVAFDMTEGLYVLKKKSERLWHILFPSSIALMLSSKVLFPLVFNPIFARSADIFCIFLLLLTSRALFPQSILLALKETKMLLLFSIIETLSIIILSFLLLKPLDTEGVAWALVIGFMIEKILIIIFLKKQYLIDFQRYTNTKLYFIYSSLLILSYFLQKIFFTI